MESRRDGFSYSLTIRKGSIREKEGCIDMHYVRPVASLTNDFLIGIAVEKVMLLAKELKDRKMEYTGAIISVREMGVLFR